MEIRTLIFFVLGEIEFFFTIFIYKCRQGVHQVIRRVTVPPFVNRITRSLRKDKIDAS